MVTVVCEFKNLEFGYMERISGDEDLHFGEYKANWGPCLFSN